VTEAPRFDAEFRATLADLIAWRRDVRRFRPDPVEPALLERLLDLASLAPSVGNSQPWRFVSVDEPARRQAVIADFTVRNREALDSYEGERAQAYAGLKLEGLRVAPVHLAVFCDPATAQGHGLGQRTMPETLRYSTVGAIQTLWLAARAEGLGLGWVSILDPLAVATALDVPRGWEFIAYLCLGWPAEEHLDPELARHGWQDRTAAGRQVLKR
jgi:5,6-dimethylbenzimidazole synthase